jgi:hypothetical protein
MGTDAKIGLLLGSIIFLIFLIFLAVLGIFFCARHKRLAGLVSGRYPAANPLHRMSYAQETQPLTSSTPEPYIEIEAIPAREPKTSMDSAGIRWPEPVVLGGDAKEIREWTEKYGRDKKNEGCERRLLESYGFWGARR